MEEPPDQDSGGDDEKTEGLITPEGAALDLAPLGFGELFLVRLDATFDHSALISPSV